MLHENWGGVLGGRHHSHIGSRGYTTITRERRRGEREHTEETHEHTEKEEQVLEEGNEEVKWRRNVTYRTHTHAYTQTQTDTVNQHKHYGRAGKHGQY